MYIKDNQTTLRQIPRDGRVRRRRRGRGLAGMGSSAADCSPGQNFYPNLTYLGITGQCSDAATAQSMLSSGQASGNLNSASTGTFTVVRAPAPASIGAAWGA